MTQSIPERFQLHYNQSSSTPITPLSRDTDWPDWGATWHRLEWLSLGNIVSVLLLATAVTLWSTSLGQIDVQQMDDTGLISVLPATVLLALFILNFSFCLAIIRRPVPQTLLFVHLLLLIFLAYGITSVVYDTPRFAIAWKLAGIIDYIMLHGTVDGRIDAFFNWPGFFILMALMTRAAGFDDPFPFMTWAPVIFNVLYLGPLWMLFRSATNDLRLVVLGMWFFYLANWIGQDYLSPQAFNIFLMLMLMAIILTWLRGPGWQAGTWPFRSSHRFAAWLQGYEHPALSSTPAQRAGLVSILILLLVAMVASHQLTPFAALAGLCALVFFNRCTARTLPLLLAILVATWVLYMAAPYLWGHIQHIAGPVGSVGTNIEANLGERFRGSPEHIFINYMRMGMSLGVWGLAFLGGLRRLHNRHRDSALALLSLTPFPLLLLQTYGGELLMRIYLFSVPFMAFFIACLFFPTPRTGHTWYTPLVLCLMSFVMTVSFLYTRYGNDRMMYFTLEEVAAVEHLYTIAEPGSQWIAATGTLPWRYQEYRTFRYTHVPPLVREADTEELIAMMDDPRYPASYLILTRSQKASGELFIGWPPGLWEEFAQMLHDSDDFRAIFTNRDAAIYVLERQTASEDAAEMEGVDTEASDIETADIETADIEGTNIEAVNGQ